MSDRYLALLELQLNRFHTILESSLPDDDEFQWAMYNVDRIMAVLCPEQRQLDGLIEELMDVAPTPDEVM